MPKYWVTLRVDGRYTSMVEASSIEEAKEKAINNYTEADFGELETIDAEICTMEDEKGNYV